MSNSMAAIGVYGLGVMGANVALNIASRGIRTTVGNRTATVTDSFMANAPGGFPLQGAADLAALIAQLERPRKLLVMVPAGAAVDAVISAALPMLEPGDIVIDAGNSHYPDTERRDRELTARGLHFVGLGVSGGEEGARHGPSLMPGGSAEAYAAIEPILQAIAAVTDSGACVSHIGRGGAGHFVKMVHNGIEYGDMQLIAETWDILRRVGGLTCGQLADTFHEWNRGRLRSYLIEITAHIAAHRDEKTGMPMVDVILDKAGQKGTGRWTVQAAAELGVPISVISTAVDARAVSSMKDQRVAAESFHSWNPGSLTSPPRKELLARLEAALYAAKIIAYAQGMAMLRAADTEFNYGLRMDEIARIWTGGCIIRADLLKELRAAFLRDGTLENLIMDDSLGRAVLTAQESLRMVVQMATYRGIAAPAFSAALSWYDGYRCGRGPASLIQAQRDYFGAHTFERVDTTGSFHERWLNT